MHFARQRGMISRAGWDHENGERLWRLTPRGRARLRSARPVAREPLPQPRVDDPLARRSAEADAKGAGSCSSEIVSPRRAAPSRRAPEPSAASGSVDLVAGVVKRAAELELVVVDLIGRERDLVARAGSRRRAPRRLPAAAATTAGARRRDGRPLRRRARAPSRSTARAPSSRPAPVARGGGRRASPMRPCAISSDGEHQAHRSAAEDADVVGARAPGDGMERRGQRLGHRRGGRREAVGDRMDRSGGRARSDRAKPPSTQAGSRQICGRLAQARLARAACHGIGDEHALAGVDAHAGGLVPERARIRRRARGARGATSSRRYRTWWRPGPRPPPRPRDRGPARRGGPRGHSRIAALTGAMTTFRPPRCAADRAPGRPPRAAAGATRAAGDR